MKEYIEQALKNYAREVRGIVASKIDQFFEKRDQLCSYDVAVEVAMFLANEAADSVSPFSFLEKCSKDLEDAKNFIYQAEMTKQSEVNDAISRFKIKLSINREARPPKAFDYEFTSTEDGRSIKNHVQDPCASNVKKRICDITDIKNFEIDEDGSIYIFDKNTWFKLEK